MLRTLNYEFVRSYWYTPMPIGRINHVSTVIVVTLF